MSDKYWYYHIEVREGAPGFADDEEYKSQKFKSFEDCFESYVYFQPSNHWSNLRRVQRESLIYFDGNKIYINLAKEGMLHYDNSEIELGITDSEFDDIIARIVNRQNNKIKKN